MDIKQVIVMRTDLNMRKGKMIAQGAHAAMMFLTKGLRLTEPYRDDVDRDYSLMLTPEETAWVKGNFKKICLQIDSEERLLALHKAAQDAGLKVNICTDSGLTEFGGVPTHTCIAIGPDNADRIDPLTKELKLL